MAWYAKELSLDAIIVGDDTLTGDMTGPSISATIRVGFRGAGTLSTPRCSGVIDTHLWTGDGRADGDYTLSLPVPTLDASISYSYPVVMSLEENLPGFDLEVRFGLRNTISLKLCDLECASIINQEYALRASSCKLSNLQLSGRMGSRLDATLPSPTIDASASGLKYIRLSRSIAPLTLDAAMSSDWGTALSLDRDLTFPGFAGQVSVQVVLNLDQKISGLLLDGDMSEDGSLSLMETLPVLQLSATGGGDQLSLDEYLPILRMSAYGSGIGQGGIGGGSMTDTSRFDNYILRYSR